MKQAAIQVGKSEQKFFPGVTIMRMKRLSDWGHTAGNPVRPELRGNGSRHGQRFNHSRFTNSSSRQSMIFLCLGGLIGTLVVLALSVASLMMGRGPAKAEAAAAPVVVTETAPVQYSRVIVPVRNIEKGAALNPQMFTSVVRPRSSLASTTITDISQIEGKFARVPINAHFPLILEWTTDEAQITNPLIQRIPTGFRAVTINVNATSGVEGWARAGARVDVHWIAELNGERTATRIVENAQILSAERQVEPSANPSAPIPTTVTLLAQENDAQKISLAATAGQLILHLRGFDDSGKATSPLHSMTVNDLLGNKEDEKRVQGLVRIRNHDGFLEELVLMDGNLVRKGQVR